MRSHSASAAGQLPWSASSWAWLSRVASEIGSNDGEWAGGWRTGAGGQSVYTAAACFAESLRVCEETGMAGERARTLRDWAACEIERGDRDRGLGMGEEARALFAELGARQEVARMAEPPAPRQREL
ncbi:MAG TPA: hypothetical protein VD886_08605 [Herpetosiphonaceae bacterium]|nr:hypothetical protein [Herpetosiphonaceae bacterium]